jgi:hypothetical protein
LAILATVGDGDSLAFDGGRREAATRRAAAPGAPAGREVALAAAFLALAGVLRVACAFRYRVDSDEPQHIHVTWGWAHGLVPYRDFFDNHAPLFHMLCAPLLRLVGEGPGTLVALRLAMIPLFLLSLLAVGLLGARLFSLRVGLWAAVFAALLPPFFFGSLEFRTDDLWAALWLFTLLTAVAGWSSRRGRFATGVLLGATASVSLKTLLMVAALLAAGALELARGWREGERLHLRERLRRIAPVIVGAPLLPLAIVVYFVARQAGPALLQDVIRHNMLSGIGTWRTVPWRPIAFVAGLPVAWRLASALARGAPDPDTAAWRRLLGGVAFFYATLLLAFWPLLTAQDWLPFAPLATLLATPAFLAAAARLPRPVRAVRAPAGAAAALVLLEVALIVFAPDLRHGGPERNAELVREVLRLTRPDETVVDLKGETEFRPRASWYVLEGLTRARLRRGLLHDDIPERLVASGTTVAVPDQHLFPPRTRAFLNANFIPAGAVRVAGRWLDPAQAGADGAIHFQVAIPAAYEIVSRRGPVAGRLDGAPCDGPRRLAPGEHVFVPSVSAAPEGRLALVWARAVELGFSPFAGAGGQG